MPSVYINPDAIEYDDNESCKNNLQIMNRFADALEINLSSVGISFARSNQQNTLSRSVAESNAGKHDLHLALYPSKCTESEDEEEGVEFFYFTRSNKGREAAFAIAGHFMSIFPDPKKIVITPTTGIAEVGRTRAPAVMAQFRLSNSANSGGWLKNNVDAVGKNFAEGMATFFGVGSEQIYEEAKPQVGMVVTEFAGLNIRARPSVTSEVLFQVPNGEKMNLYCNTGLWYAVEYNGIIGFAYSKFILIV